MIFTAEETAALVALRRRVEHGQVSDYYDTRLYRVATFLMDYAAPLILGCLAVGLSVACLLAALLWNV
jgi:hypothetical protein